MTAVRGMPSITRAEQWLVFDKRRDGMIHALEGGMWFHRHVFNGQPMAHVVSSDKQRLLRAGLRIGMKAKWLQYKPLKNPRTGERLEAWHWDLRGWSLAAGEQIVAAGPLAIGKATARDRRPHRGPRTA